MIYWFKILPALLMPTTIVAAVLLASLLFKRRALAVLALLLLGLSSNAFIANHMMAFAERGRLHQAPDQVPPVDAIVVLSGMIRDVATVEGGTVPEWGDAADRFEAGITLMQLGKAPVIAFTGGRLPWSATYETEGSVLRSRAIARGVNPSQIYLTTDVENTAQEAEAIKQWLASRRENTQPRILLVTSAFHMTRAQSLFARAGLSVVPYAVDFRNAAGALEPELWFPSGEALDK
ncbi:MAG: YdcF family protein, partial [Burkholderiaceae bacterium]|nr:YdcF family protein [Burkholderiaceae bacterium]